MRGLRWGRSGKSTQRKDERRSCAGQGPAAPINDSLVMDPVSRGPEIYFIKNHLSSIGHRIGDSLVAPGLE